MSKYNSKGHVLQLNDNAIFGVIINIDEDFEFSADQLIAAIRKADTVSISPLAKKSSKANPIADILG